MESNMNLVFGFKGAAEFNGVGQNVHTLPVYRGGIISDIIGNASLTAYFGYAVSEDPTLPDEFLIGIQSQPFVGIIAFDPAIAENQPAMPTSFVNKSPVTICYFGPVWYKSWTKTASGAIDPVPGCSVITENATGKIEFIAATTAVPTGWTTIPASVVLVDSTTNGALIWLGMSGAIAGDANYIVDALGHQLPKLPFSSDTLNALNFASRTVGSDLTGTIISTGTTWLVHATAGQCAVKLLCSTTATTGDYATLRIRARSDAANATQGGVVAGNFSASANIAEFGNLIAVQGYAQNTGNFAQTRADHIMCGLYSCIDSGGVSSGRQWSLWVDQHATVRTSGSNYLARFSHNGTVNYDGIFTIYQGYGGDNLFNFENGNAPVASGDKTGGTKTYALAVKINGVDGYLQWYAK
jgi:hypothetical protein